MIKLITSNRSRLHTIYEFTDSINGVTQIEEKDLIDETLEIIINVHILDKDNMPKPRLGTELSKYIFGTKICIEATSFDFGAGQRVSVELKSSCASYVFSSKQSSWIDDDDGDDDDGFASCQSMLDTLRCTVNEFVDMSKGQVYFEDVINKLNELGFKIC